MSETSMLDWALYYQSQGLSIIPVKGKTPLIKWKEFQERKANEEEIKAWWTQWPEADIGTITGSHSERLVLDIDGEEGYKALQEFNIPITQTTQTTRGKQYHFKFPDGLSAKTTVAGIFNQVDTRGEGGYVKLPPSLFSDNSGRYSWERGLNFPIAEAPEWLINLLKNRREQGEPSIAGEEGTNEHWLEDIIDGVEERGRHQALVRLAGYLFNAFPSNVAITQLREWNQKNRPPIEEAEFEEQLNDLKTRFAKGEYQSNFKIESHSETQSITDFLADEQKVEWLVPGIIAKGSLGFVAGLQETGKTWVLIDLAVEMAKGGGLWLGKFPTKSAKVLFIDQERHKSETQRRFKAVISAKSLLPQELSSQLQISSGTTTRLNLQQSFDAFRKKLQELRPDVVMIDSFATFHTVGENDRMAIQVVLEQIKSLRNEFGCTFLFINHEGKSVLHHEPGEVKEPHSANMMGSVAVPAAAELVLTVRRKDNETCLCYHTKSTLGPKIEPFTVVIEDLDTERSKICVKAY